MAVKGQGHGSDVGTWFLPGRLEIVLLGLVILLGYGPIIHTYFLADDFAYIHGVLDGEGRPDWSVVVRHLYSSQHVDTFRPIVTLLHTLGYSLWGASPAGYHLLNLLFHFLNSLLLYSLVARLNPCESRLIPLLSAALFATHPAHPESVTYISGIAGLSCLTFYLASLVLYLRYVDTRRLRWGVLSLASFILALASKEEAISLPFAIALIALTVADRPLDISKMRQFVFQCMIYFSVLGIYSAYRFYIFGRITPSYYQDLSWTITAVMAGLVSYLIRIISPVNISYVGPMGRKVFIVMFGIIATCLLFCIYKQRLNRTAIVVCCVGFLITLIPIYHALTAGIDDGLTYSHFLYFPLTAYVTALAFIILGKKKEGELRRIDACLALLLIGLNLGLLTTNNKPWAQAGDLMRLLQQQAVKLTGGRLPVEIANIPDTVNGVFFDRGGFQHALLTPFVPGNALDRREMTLIVTGEGEESLTIEGQFPEPGVFAWRIDPKERSDTQTPQALHAWFRPREAREYRGKIIVRHPHCRGPVAEIPVMGKGTHVAPFATYLAASVVPGPSQPRPTTHATYLASVTDLADGIPAEEVGFSLAPGVPWQLRYFPLSETRQVEAPNSPVRIPDGKSKNFLLEVTPNGPSRESFIVLRISALNAPIIMPIPGQTIIEWPRTESLTASALPGRELYNNSKATGNQPVRYEQPLALCARVTISPKELNFGLVPISPHKLGPQRLFHYYGQIPEVLFWDDINRRVIPISALEKAPGLLTVAASDLAKWEHAPHVAYYRVSPTIAALRTEGTEAFVSKSDLDIPASQAAYFLVRMRILGASLPFARLWWTGETNKGYHNGLAFLTTVPDGYWHTYAIPLHAQPNWSSLRRIRRLRFDPLLKSGGVEIDSIKVIGNISLDTTDKTP